MIPGLTLITVLALQSFTETTTHGQFHGDPDSERNRRPKVPDYVVGKLLASGKIALLDVDADEGEAGASAPLESNSKSPFESVDYEMKHLGFGRYAVSGPGIAPGNEIKGKADAETLIATARQVLIAAAIDEAPID